jgi:hypothetical protein
MVTKLPNLQLLEGAFNNDKRQNAALLLCQNMILTQ